MENKMQDSKREEYKSRNRKLEYLVIGYGLAKTEEDSKRQFREIIDYFASEISKAREEVLKDLSEIIERNAFVQEVGDDYTVCDTSLIEEFIESELDKLSPTTSNGKEK